MNSISPVMIDVREKDEFDAESIPGSFHVPLSRFTEVAPPLFGLLQGRKATVICGSGVRSKLACGMIEKLGIGNSIELENYQGGIRRWKELGLPVTTQKSGHFPLMRQVQLAAGLLVVSSVALAVAVDFRFIGIAGFVGAGLTVAGATGFCGMALVLNKMPWNQRNTTGEVFSAPSER